MIFVVLLPVLSRHIYRSLRDYGDSRCQPPPSWISEILKFCWLTGFKGPSSITLPNFVKCVNLLWQFFNFSRWRPSAILDLFETHSDHPQRALGGLYHCAEFGCNRCSSLEDMKVWILHTLGLKTPIHAPPQKNGVLGKSDALSGEQHQRFLKNVHSYASPRRLRHQARKSAHRSDLAIGQFPQRGYK